MLQGMASNIDFRLARGIASVAFAALALFADNAAAQKKAEPKPRSPEKLVEALFEADGWSPEGRRERADILLELEALPALEAKDIAKWKSSCAKLWAKGTKLEKKNGLRLLRTMDLFVLNCFLKWRQLYLCLHLFFQMQFYNRLLGNCRKTRISKKLPRFFLVRWPS
jgi:hypothetical protein